MEEELVEAGWQILALSPDRPENLKPTVETHELGYRLLSDSKMEAAKAFGLAYRVSSEYESQLDRFGIDLGEASGEEHGLLPVPAVYLVGEDGSVLFQYVNPDYRVRIPAELVLAAARVL